MREKIKIKRRGRGRPASVEPLGPFLHIQITHRQKRWIDDVARTEGRTIAQVVRRVLFAEPIEARE